MSKEDAINAELELAGLKDEAYIDFRDEGDIVLDGHFSIDALKRIISTCENLAPVFYPNRITLDANGNWCEERLAINQWPQWAQDAINRRRNGEIR